MTGLAHQIRAVRMQRGLTQDALAKLMATTQAAVSRLEDPAYGRYSLKTLIDLAKTFDTGLQVRFVSFVTMLAQTYMPDAKAREVPAFEDEAPSVGFYRSSGNVSVSNFVSKVALFPGSPVSYLSLDVSRFCSHSKFITTDIVQSQ